MTYESYIDECAEFTRQEFEVDFVDIVGEPVTLSNGERLSVFEAPNDGAVFFIRYDISTGARHENPDLEKFGDGDYKLGVLKAVGLYSTIQLLENGVFDSIVAKIDGLARRT